MNDDTRLNGALGDSAQAWTPLAPAKVSAFERGLSEQQHRQGFHIGGLALMVSYAEGSELTEIPILHRLPRAPVWLLGICNLHGALVPVFDLARRFGVERAAPAQPMLLVLGHGPDAAGIVVDGLPERLRFDDEHVLASAQMPAALAGLIARAVLIDKQLWLDLDTPALLDALAAPPESGP